MTISYTSPAYLKSINELQAGDIILFRAPQTLNASNSMIMLFQSLIWQKHGHYDTTHVAICTGNDKHGKPHVAHLIGKPVMGFAEQPLEDYLREPRPMLIYRPKNTQVAANLSTVAKNNNEQLQWKVPTAISSFFIHSALNPRRILSNAKMFSKYSFCSKFVIEALKIATSGAYNTTAVKSPYYPDIRSSSSPKTLEAYLYNNTGAYDVLLHTGIDNPYEVLKKEILDQMHRIKQRTDKASLNKYAKLLVTVNETVKKLAAMNPPENDLNKGIVLLKSVSDILRINTGCNISTATSYKSVWKKARSLGIFQSDIREHGQPESASMNNTLR